MYIKNFSFYYYYNIIITPLLPLSIITSLFRYILQVISGPF